MKTFLATVMVLVIGLAAYSFFNSKRYKFYYFPETNMYYDTRKGQYIYSMDGGITWSIMGRTIDKIPQALGEKIVLKSKSPNIWEHNAEHRAQYNGVLTDVNALIESRSNHSAKTGKGIHADGKKPGASDTKLDAGIKGNNRDSISGADNSTEEENELIDIGAAVGINEENVLSRNAKKPAAVPTPLRKDQPKRSDSTQKAEDSSDFKTPVMIP